MQEDLPNHDGPVDTEEEQGKCSEEQIAPDHDAPIIAEGPVQHYQSHVNFRTYTEFKNRNRCR